jgi:16S rRNA (guanine(966)-N(2))-methyltransferase RsmD
LLHVVAGKAKGKKLMTTCSEMRPTAGLVKEALFNIIQFEIAGAHVLDLFAGSGQLGIEALSRGALDCVFVEANYEAGSVIVENLKRSKFLNCAEVNVMLAADFFKKRHRSFDVAILDPPYGKKLIDQVMIDVVNLMAKNGVIIFEAAKTDLIDVEFQKYNLVKEYFYGKKKLGLFREETGP